jgi:hypothetical protein
VGQIITSNGGRFRESRQSPKVGGALVPRRAKYGSHVGQNDSQNNKGNLGFEQKNVQVEI